MVMVQHHHPHTSVITEQIEDKAFIEANRGHDYRRDDRFRKQGGGGPAVVGFSVGFFSHHFFSDFFFGWGVFFGMFFCSAFFAPFFLPGFFLGGGIL